MSVVEMRVHKYIPERLFGFTIDEAGLQVFFHLGAFNPGEPQKEHPRCSSCRRDGCTWVLAPPPPILGERVNVTADLDTVDATKAPRATRVIRLEPTIAVRGEVETFDAQRGYGFIKGENGTSYHLHKSELLGGRIPRTGQMVMFYAGMRQERPRAVHIKVCPL